MNRTDFIYTDTYFPELTMPVNFKTGDTLLFFESKQIYWKISTILKNKKEIVDKLNISGILCPNATHLIETFNSNQRFFIPDRTKNLEKLYYFGNLDTLGIQTFLTLKEEAKINNLQPWITMYERLIDKSTVTENSFGKNRLEISQKKLDKFTKYFDQSYQQMICNLLLYQERSISYEILSVKDFLQ
ncbi:hypothetical protein [Lactobacillus paragasseri]|uniref:hypothetical protein n=1 Tax=Lactobacillus paragasseri TaxID=2107999 RepID=UPI0021CAEDA5|nr:hypothetical protein [Lactobacillus paragasseri]